MAGSLAGCDSWFNNPASQVSSTYGTSLTGELHQYVRLEDTHWANGVLEYGNGWASIGTPGVNPNKESVSIETEDLGNPHQAVTPQEYEATKGAALLALERYPGIRYLCTHTVVSPQSRPQCCGDRWTKSGYFQKLADELGLEARLM